MSVVALDSSCMVAAVCSWHERHAVVAAEIERRLAARARLAIPARALIEAYAVLTRLPAPHRIAPADAWAPSVHSGLGAMTDHRRASAREL